MKLPIVVQKRIDLKFTLYFSCNVSIFYLFQLQCFFFYSLLLAIGKPVCTGYTEIYLSIYLSVYLSSLSISVTMFSLLLSSMAMGNPTVNLFVLDIQKSIYILSTYILSISVTMFSLLLSFTG